MSLGGRLITKLVAEIFELSFKKNQGPLSPRVGYHEIKNSLLGVGLFWRRIAFLSSPSSIPVSLGQGSLARLVDGIQVFRKVCLIFLRHLNTIV